MAGIQCPECGAQLKEGLKFCPKCGCAVSSAAQRGNEEDRTILLTGQRQNMPDMKEEKDRTVLLFGNEGGNFSAQGNAGQGTPPLRQPNMQAQPNRQAQPNMQAQPNRQAQPNMQAQPNRQAQPNPQAGQPASRKAAAQKAAPQKAKKEPGGKKGTALIAVICVEAGLLLGIGAVIALLFLGIL